MNISREQLKLYAVTDRQWLKPGETLASTVELLLQSGVTCVQLREKQLEDTAFLREAWELREICHHYGVPLIINDRPDLAAQAIADGVHVGLSDMDLFHARRLLGAAAVIGGSAHNVREALAAQAAGADYIGCGAVFGSRTKADVGQLSLDELQRICKAVTIPVVAIGGITLENVNRLAGTGIAGAAVISALFSAEDKQKTVRDFLTRLSQL